MTTTEPFLSIHETGEHLCTVKGFFFIDENSDEMLVALKFRFDNESVVLVAQEDDSFEVLGDDWRCTEKNILLRDLSEEDPWKFAISKPLLWSWRMINQQGYFDGIQLQFGVDVTDSLVKVQLIVIASEIKVFKI